MRHKSLPLTETTYLILLALIEPGHGYVIMQKVEDLSNHEVKIAAGTMYGALDNLLKQKWITTVPSEDKRRKVYQITEEGMEVLQAETKRMENILELAHSMMKGR